MITQETAIVWVNKNKPAIRERLLRFPYSYLWIAIITLVVYGQVLFFIPGKLDEYNIILINLDFLRDFGNLKEALLTNPFFNKGGDFYRPVQNLTFMIDAHLSGQDGWGYYLTNLLLHTVTCTLLFSLLLLYGRDRRIAFWLTLLFTVHPLFVQTIAWAPSRGDMLIAVFGLASIISFVRYTRNRNYLFLFLHILFYALAVFSKESAIVIPVLCFLGYFLLEKEKRIRVRGLVIPLICYITVAGAFLYIRDSIIHTVVDPGQFGLLPLIHNIRTIPDIIFKFFIPVGLSPMPAFSWIHTITGLVVLGILAWFTIRSGRDSVRVFLFGMTWFLIFLGPALLYINKYGSASCDYMEHRGYLPLAGIVLILFQLAAGWPTGKRIGNLYLCLSIVVMVFGIYSFIYARNYKTTEQYYSYAVRTNPASATAVFSRGVVRMYEQRDFRNAILDFERAIRIFPEYPQAYLNLGYCQEQLDNPAGALEAYKTSSRLNPVAYEPHLAMAFLYSSAGMKKQSLAEYDTVLLLAPDTPLAWYRRGMLKYEIQDLEGALRDLDQAIHYDERFTDAYINRAILKFNLQDHRGAIDDLDRVIAIDGSNAVAYLNRGRIYYFMQEYQLSCRDWLTAGSLGNEEAKSLWEEYCR